jgi:putative transposase
MTPTILPGTLVFVRQDPNDAGRAYAFAQDGAEFLGDAICPELSGLHPETLVRAAKEIRGELVDESDPRSESRHEEDRQGRAADRARPRSRPARHAERGAAAQARAGALDAADIGRDRGHGRALNPSQPLDAAPLQRIAG